MRVTIGVAVLIAIAIGTYLMTAQTQTEPVSETASLADSAIVEVTAPDSLSENAEIGKTAFEAACASCHGVSAVGQVDVAPPLVHVIYEPSHHGDEAFQLAVMRGVRGHHWPFGNMPPVEGLTRGDVTMIVAYIRELQRANGIN